MPELQRRHRASPQYRRRAHWNGAHCNNARPVGRRARANDNGSPLLTRHGQNDREIALGRRNSLFAGSCGGAESWAVLASLLQTARLNGLDPFTWLNDVLERIVSGAVKSHELGQLLAWNWKARQETSKLAAAA
jgi:hypothetical protein